MMRKKLVQLCRLVLSDRNTRNLFSFLVINLIFAFVELTYGLWTNSLGLISDSFHMFFDCSALLLGLAASIVAKWKASDKFTYGFGRAEILAGLANGLFLLFIALFIMKEAIERTFEPPEVHHERLFAISVLGFLVNLIGIFVFQHGGQSHAGCSHSHSHASSAPTSAGKQYNNNNNNNNNKSTASHSDYKYDNLHGYSHYSNPTIVEEHHHEHHHEHHDHKHQQQHSVALDMNGYASHGFAAAPQAPDNGHHNHHHHHHQHHHQGSEQHSGHKHHGSDLEPFIIDDSSHKHSHSHAGAGGHRGQIMQSVFLHIVADTLGSVGVMISALLMNNFGWMIADPLCSLFIAILISISVFPLLKDSIYILMQRIPVDLDHKLPDCLFKVQNLEGVLSVHETHFWTLNSDSYVGCLKLEVNPGANHRAIQEQTKRLLHQIGVNQAHIQIDYAQ